MKKRPVLTALLILLAALTFGSVAACGIFDGGGFEFNGGDNVTYYGCPNSRRVKKLNLRKNRRTR